MIAVASYREKVLNCLREFLENSGLRGAEFNERTNLIRGLGLKSDQGVDFVLDLCDVLEFEFPKDFNPFVHSNGRRGRRVGEMLDAIDSLISARR
jgi:hypothetical protein